MRCAIILNKTQREVKEGYYWTDLPKILKMKNQEKAKSLLDDIQVSQFPHITDSKIRKDIVDSIRKQLPKQDTKPIKYDSPEDQYEALKKRKALI